MGRFAHAEYPNSRTRRLISNVRIRESSDDTLLATSNFVVYRMRMHTTETYVGRYEHTFVHQGGVMKIRERRAILDMEALRPHGKVGFLL